MSIWEKIMGFFGLRPVRPPITPLYSSEEVDAVDLTLQKAVQEHKDLTSRVIERSLDTVDKTEEVRVSLKAIFDRSTVPGIASAEGAWELVRGKHNDAHRP